MLTHTCSSTLMIFFWKEDRSFAARFRATTTACVALRTPTVALPCFTASCAYSIWWMRPCGLNTDTSESYWFRNMPMLLLSVHLLDAAQYL